MIETHEPRIASPLDGPAIRELVERLSRPQPSGARVVERAAIVAAGDRSAAILTWIAAHDGKPETLDPPSAKVGLHSARAHTGPRTVLRYVLPPGVFS